MIQLATCAETNGTIGRWGQLFTNAALGAQRLELSQGAVICDPTARGGRIYFIHSGQVRTYQTAPDGSAQLLEILGAGDWFGEEALADAESHSSRAVAASHAVVSALPVEQLMDLLGRQPETALELIQKLATRLQAARAYSNGFVFDDCTARLVKTLLRFSNTSAATVNDSGIVMLRITHRQLAEAVGAARETVSLALSQLRSQDLLRTGRNRLMFKPEVLKTHGKGN